MNQEIINLEHVLSEHKHVNSFLKLAESMLQEGTIPKYMFKTANNLAEAYLWKLDHTSKMKRHYQETESRLLRIRSLYRQRREELKEKKTRWSLWSHYLIAEKSTKMLGKLEKIWDKLQKMWRVKKAFARRQEAESEIETHLGGRRAARHTLGERW